ncbi:DExH-box ATP-dependent RNA helicase DExH12-like protein [Tanacetum coccineum]
MSDIELCRLFSQSEEFNYVTVRQDEKMELAKLLEYSFLIFLPPPICRTLVLQSAGHLMRALFEIVLKQGLAQLAEKALNLCKMINKRIWSVQTPLRQFHGIKNDILMKLEKKDLAWERYYDLTSQELGELVRSPKLGRNLHRCIHQFPKLNLAAHVQLTRTIFRVELTITPDFQWEDKIHGKVPTTELLDLQPLPVTALRNPLYESLYQEFKHFNPIQTQVFTVLYNTDDNVLVAAPTGSGKTICAEFAKLRNHQKGDESVMRAVSMLTGETATDLKSLEKSQIIISTPDRWDALSRRWKQRKHVQQVSLFIVDELHLIGGLGWPVLEVMPVPLEVHIQIANFKARMQAMSKPTYTAIVQHAKNKKPAIVFVLMRKHARLTAVDLMTYSSAESKYAGADSGQKPLFLVQSEDELAPFIDRIRDSMLKETLKYGVGYSHEGLNATDQDIVKTLFDTGCTQVCVMSGTMCRGISLRAHLLVVMGTQYYDGRENTHADYPITDLLQMMGHASRPLVDNSGKCDAVDYLTWTFMYRRLTQDTNYYNLLGVSQRHLSDHLSELVENTLSDLEASKCVTIEEDFDLSPNNLGMIASYYYISYTMIERFSFSITSKTKLKGLLEILATASEYELLPIRPGEE